MAGQTDRQLIDMAFNVLELNPVDSIREDHRGALQRAVFFPDSDRARLQEIWDNGVALLPAPNTADADRIKAADVVAGIPGEGNADA